MVVIRTPNGATAEYRLRHAASGLRLEMPTASYDLLAMLNAGWEIVGTKTHAAERLLRRAGLLTSDIERLPPARRSRWCRSLMTAPRERTVHATPKKRFSAVSNRSNASAVDAATSEHLGSEQVSSAY